jgi:hypothetical protein
MEKTAVVQSSPRMRGDWRRYLLLAAVVLGLAVGGLFAYRAWDANRQGAQAAQIAEMQAQVMAAIDAQWGIRVTQVVATADGGLVDLRYQITDPDKAIFLFDDVANFPRLVAEDSGVEIALTTLPHQHDLEFGQVYFILFRNAANAVKPGGLVTVMVGGLAVEHFAVES